MDQAIVTGTHIFIKLKLSILPLSFSIITKTLYSLVNESPFLCNKHMYSLMAIPRATLLLAMYVCMYVRMYVCMYVCTCMCIDSLTNGIGIVKKHPSLHTSNHTQTVHVVCATCMSHIMIGCDI